MTLPCLHSKQRVSESECLMYLDNKLKSVKLRIICVLILQNAYNQCIYRVYCSDGGFTDYLSYDRVPQTLKDWLADRNTFDYTIPSAMVVSGVKVV